MTTQTLSNSIANTDKTTFLRRVLQADAAVVAVSGLALIGFAQPFADFLGSTGIDSATMTTILRLIGLLFFPIAAFVLYTANSQPLKSRFAWGIIGFDFVWALTSLALLVTNALGLSTGGNWLMLIQADIVLLFGIMEWVGISRAKSTRL